MLNVTSIHKPAGKIHRRRIRISGQSIAKANRGPRHRAWLAAQWLVGALAIHPPTMLLASQVFGVSPQLIRRAALSKNSTIPIESEIEAAWRSLYVGDRDEFVREHLEEIWDAIERVTKPAIALTLCQNK